MIECTIGIKDGKYFDFKAKHYYTQAPMQRGPERMPEQVDDFCLPKKFSSIELRGVNKKTLKALSKHDSLGHIYVDGLINLNGCYDMLVNVKDNSVKITF